MKPSILTAALTLLVSGIVSCQCCCTSSQLSTEEANAAAHAKMSDIASAITHFQSKNGGQAPDMLDRLIEKDANGKAYMDLPGLPNGPYGRDFAYTTGNGGMDWELAFLGKDGEPGGEGADADIVMGSAHN